MAVRWDKGGDDAFGARFSWPLKDLATGSRKPSLTVGLITPGIAMSFSLMFGMVAGYYRGRTEGVRASISTFAKHGAARETRQGGNAVKSRYLRRFLCPVTAVAPF